MPRAYAVGAARTVLDEDAFAIASYLKSLPAVANPDFPPQADNEAPAAAYQDVIFPPGVTPPGPPPGAPPPK